VTHEAMHWRTKLLHSKAHAPGGFRSLAPAIHRGSTVVFDRLADATDDWRSDAGYTYGLYGTPTTKELAQRIAEMEGARHSFIVPGGQAAIALVYLACCPSGSHALIPDSAYGPNRELAEDLLLGLGIEVETYSPLIGGEIANRMRPNTRLIWCESPGSVTMEVQDVPAITKVARARGVPVAIDNTYSAGVLFDAFAAGVDISIQALTKYVGGHSDLLLGTVSVGTESALDSVGRVHRLLGMAVSPDDCSLALRGLQTLGVRLQRLEATALAVAHWLRARDEIAIVLHPALPECPGHDTWRRDFTGSASVFSIIFKPEFGAEHITRFVESLELFAIGFSWGGVHALVMAYPALTRSQSIASGRIVRLNVGLEEPDDLISDLRTAFDRMRDLPLP
jgi:cystathionine beta-lyase